MVSCVYETQPSSHEKRSSIHSRACPFYLLSGKATKMQVHQIPENRSGLPQVSEFWMPVFVLVHLPRVPHHPLWLTVSSGWIVSRRLRIHPLNRDSEVLFGLIFVVGGERVR